MSSDGQEAATPDAGARAVANDAMREILSLRQEFAEDREEMQREIRSLRAEVDDLRDKTDLLTAVRKSEATSREEKAAICIQTLVNEAREKPEGRRKSWMSASQGVKALGGGVDRTSLYGVFKTATTLVADEDVLTYVTEPRGSDPPSRLMVDLDDGEMPSAVAGHRITTGGEV